MVDRKPISDAARFGVWKAWAGKCAFCREPVLYKNCHIDHAIPLAACSAPEDRATIITDYSLPTNFDFDDFPNWICTCPGCNLLKSKTTFDASPIFLLMLAASRQKGRFAHAIALKIQEDHKKTALLVKVKNAVAKGDITESDIRSLFSGLPVIVRKSATVDEERLFLAPGWQVLEKRGDLVFVGTGGRVGYTSASNDMSWFCPHCGNKGPWNGVICLSCGHMSDPND
jgi:hypothetical protein